MQMDCMQTQISIKKKTTKKRKSTYMDVDDERVRACGSVACGCRLV